MPRIPDPPGDPRGWGRVWGRCPKRGQRWEGTRGSAPALCCSQLGPAAAAGLWGGMRSSEGGTGVFGANTGGLCPDWEQHRGTGSGEPGTSRVRWLLLLTGPKPPGWVRPVGWGCGMSPWALRSSWAGTPGGLPLPAHEWGLQAGLATWQANNGQRRGKSLLPWLWHGVGAAISGTAGFGVKGSKSAGGKPILVFSREQMGLCISMWRSGTQRSRGEPPALLLGFIAPRQSGFLIAFAHIPAGEEN